VSQSGLGDVGVLLPGIRSKAWIVTTGGGNLARQYLAEKGREILLTEA
jgi:hypothetical protein